MTDHLSLIVPDHALVIVLTDTPKLVEQIAQAIPGPVTLIPTKTVATTNVDPIARELLDDHQAVVVMVPHDHRKAHQLLTSIARKKGALSLVIDHNRPAYDPKREKHDLYLKIEHLPEAISATRSRMPNDLRDCTAGIDVIGDIHGCADELEDLLLELGHAKLLPNNEVELIRHPEGRRVALVGDLTDRGPQNLAALRLAYRLHRDFDAIVTLGNHDHKLMRWLRGNKINAARGLQGTILELEDILPIEKDLLHDWLASLETNYTLHGGDLVICHAGLPEEYHGRRSPGANSHAMYGRKADESDESDVPALIDWTRDYRGRATVVHGHIVTPEPRIRNNVVSIDTGCVFGGSLTAFRYPERSFVSVPARARHFDGDPARILE